MARGFVWGQRAGSNQAASPGNVVSDACTHSVHHSRVPGGCQPQPLLQSLEGSSLTSCPEVEGCAARGAGSLPNRQCPEEKHLTQ